MTRRWLAIREFAGGHPVIVAARWTPWGALRAARRDKNSGQYAPDRLYRWLISHREQRRFRRSGEVNARSWWL